MNIIDRINGLEKELSSLKTEHIKSQYERMKLKYLHLVGRCYERNYQGEYFLIEYIDYNVNVNYMLEIELVGILVIPYDYSPRIEDFRVKLINYEEDYSEITFDEFNVKLNETIELIKKVVNKFRLQENGKKSEIFYEKI